ncbi:uncharacterized protein BX663DRAFT_521022 [Cokeromyces recurvatus]|uniref:uncharacterized protein n=1 Tax=Cokeromyces recurvatus TaxID=90255 RepID=UPI002220175E|nr:uncharacterized protein BX663DRAFT_521022 [Cokeromyces recurvatus]KAI7899471.1 hypothetical protein BX663DRAFT_521022 [Cokeromyces recurvatus]
MHDNHNPPPTPVIMLPMTEADKQRLGIPNNHPHPQHPHHHGAEMHMMAAPMGAINNRPPNVGGMGPNFVFNFSQPPGYGPIPMPVAIAETSPPEEKVVLVQGEPTWRNPRRVAKQGEPLKPEPCIIQ